MMAIVSFGSSFTILSDVLSYKVPNFLLLRGQNTSCVFQQQEAGVTPEARRDRAAILRHDGVAPARFGVFFCVTFLTIVSFICSFSSDLCPLQGEEGGEDEAEVGNPFPLHLLRANSRRARARRRKLLVGVERPTTHFGHGTVCKSGVAPAQHGVSPASKLIVAPGATFCPLGACSVAMVSARVTHMVICVFHAPVTSPRCK